MCCCRSLYINLVGLWAILVCATLCGLALYSIYKDCDPWTANQVSALDQVGPHKLWEKMMERCPSSAALITRQRSVKSQGFGNSAMLENCVRLRPQCKGVTWRKQQTHSRHCQSLRPPSYSGAASPSALCKVTSRESCNVESAQSTHLAKGWVFHPKWV